MILTPEFTLLAREQESGKDKKDWKVDNKQTISDGVAHYTL